MVVRAVLSCPADALQSRVEYPAGSNLASVIALRDIAVCQRCCRSRDTSALSYSPLGAVVFSQEGEELLTSYIEESAPFEERTKALQ